MQEVLFGLYVPPHRCYGLLLNIPGYIFDFQSNRKSIHIPILVLMYGEDTFNFVDTEQL